MLDLWYKNAVVYCVDVETFMDADGDGCGDFQGLADRLDHIEALGANCIWLLPFYASPNRDNGYDISDFYQVDPRLGTLGDFVRFAREANGRGIRVIVDLVVNHTSIDHPWFQHARSDPSSRFRDYFLWSKEKPEGADEGVVFPGVQDTTWTWDETAQAYYFHRFYAHQADLNLANPAVREEIEKIMGFWLELGVSGFRLDAVPFLIEDRPRSPFRSADPNADADPHAFLTYLRRFLSWRKAEAILLAEANVPMDTIPAYFGEDGERMTMVFDFLLNQATFLSLARGDARPMASLMRERPPIHEVAQWATFLRNHDELDLGRLSDEEREEVFSAFAPEERMRLYERGIRRRLAPMLGGDVRRLAMAYSLMLALPGTPVFWYGEEIGMGENLDLEERSAVRTPFQWTEGPTGGFSTAPEDELARAVVTDPDYAPKSVNVAQQGENADSLLERIRRLVRARRAAPEIGWGRTDILETGDPGVLALRATWRGASMITLHNLAARQVTVTLDIADAHEMLRPVLCDSGGRLPQKADDPIALPPHGYAWFRADEERR
ncbi:alpha-amylase family protein [Salinarimonas ramus]|uniref:Alpha-amylase n=1 Tax=Salinarimonas ramus TaxID=690164 RepID=A0A917Q667_9HYPH|nr:alpha-amylase family protein [Salinarimonas ramus]GGK29547.1 trehalose synthase [Salinarimonas ramus]